MTRGYHKRGLSKRVCDDELKNKKNINARSHMILYNLFHHHHTDKMPGMYLALETPEMYIDRYWHGANVIEL